MGCSVVPPISSPIDPEVGPKIFGSRNMALTVVRRCGMNDLTAFQRDMLFVVSGLGAPKGVEVKAELDAYYESEIHHGRLYPNLEELVEKGLISKGQKDNRTNEYTLTEQGAKAIETRREWEDHYREI